LACALCCRQMNLAWFAAAGRLPPKNTAKSADIRYACLIASLLSLPNSCRMLRGQRPARSPDTHTGKTVCLFSYAEPDRRVSGSPTPDRGPQLSSSKLAGAGHQPLCCCPAAQKISRPASSEYARVAARARSHLSGLGGTVPAPPRSRNRASSLLGMEGCEHSGLLAAPAPRFRGTAPRGTCCRADQGQYPLDNHKWGRPGAARAPRPPGARRHL